MDILLGRYWFQQYSAESSELFLKNLELCIVCNIIICSNVNVHQQALAERAIVLGVLALVFMWTNNDQTKFDYFLKNSGNGFLNW